MNSSLFITNIHIVFEDLESKNKITIILDDACD